jgi:hypothetical protein
MIHLVSSRVAVLTRDLSSTLGRMLSDNRPPRFVPTIDLRRAMRRGRRSSPTRTGREGVDPSAGRLGSARQSGWTQVV